MNDRSHITGIISVTGAYIIWGLLPIYWKLLNKVPAREVLAHRILWSFIFMVAVLFFTGRIKVFLAESKNILHNRKKLLGTITTSAILSINWLTFIWAVSNEHVVEASLGYYINPLLSVMLGVIVLKEQLSLWQITAFLLAFLGVVNIVINFGSVPWVALILALTFSLYGLNKKIVNVGTLTGLTLETFIISPFALFFITRLYHNQVGAFGTLPAVTWLLMGAGVATSVPLLLFSNGAKKLPLFIVGFLQYTSPTLMLILGVFLYHEPFTTVHLVSFSLIWVALTIFSLSKTPFFVRIEYRVRQKALHK